MSSNTFFRAPSDWVRHVITTLETRLKLSIESTYQREATEPTGTVICYHIGESEVINHTGNDGRKLHEIELRFLVYVPLAVADFDLEALDASTRLERELLNELWGCGENVEETRLVSNQPRKFNPAHGVFLRTVTMKQRIYMGPVSNDYLMLVGSDFNANAIAIDPAD